MKKILIIRHAILETIDATMAAALVVQTFAESVQLIGNIEVRPLRISREEQGNVHWDSAARAQQQQYEKEIRPLLHEHAEAIICYFGQAPIPLAIHLGYLMQNYRQIKVAFQAYTGEKNWYFDHEAATEIAWSEPIERLKKPSIAKGSVLLRLSTSFLVHPEDTNGIAPDAIAEYDIRLTQPDVKRLWSQRALESVEKQIMEALQALQEDYPHAERIYLLAAINVGIAFTMGTKINPTICPLVQTFLYDKNKEIHYTEALTIQALEDRIVPTDEEKAQAQELRVRLANHLEKEVYDFIAYLKNQAYDNWLLTIDPRLNKTYTTYWNSLPALYETILNNPTSIALGAIDLSTGNYNKKTHEWHLEDALLVPILRRKVDALRALRMFLFHESLHFSEKGHCFHGNEAEGIGAFPKVIEEADYQADVWAMLHEYAYTVRNSKEPVNAKSIFCQIIETAIETMWSFDDNGHLLNLFQIRRMNRYLIWYWHLVQIERMDKDSTIEDICKILMHKPCLEFAGLPVVSGDRRAFYKLNELPTPHWQFAMFVNNRLKRYAVANMELFVKGFRECNSRDIKRVVASLIANN